MNLFDANAVVGCSSSQRPDFPHVRDLLAHMDRLGIARALAWDVAAADFQTRWGNQHLLDELEATPEAAGRVWPAFVITANILHERGSLEWLASAMEQRGVRALRCPPGLALEEIEPVLEAVLRRQPVLFLKANGFPKPAILALAERFPALPIVLTEATWGEEVKMLDLLRRRENLCLEISFLHTQGGIERFARYFGAERVLFGTGYRSHQGASLAALAGADLTEADRGEIAHANLERLLGVAPLSAMSAAQPGRLSRFWDRLLAGERLGCDVIDAHGHLGPLGSYVTEECDTAAQARQALSWMDRLGVSAMIVSGSQALFTDPVEGNRALEETLAPHGERFRGYLAFNPSYAAELEPLIEDFFSRPFWAGLKLLCDYWGVPVTDPRFRPVWEYANAHRLPILIHSWGGSLDAPAMLREIVPAYPEAAFVLAHAGGPARREAEDLAVDHPNVYLEWCGSFTRPDSWEQTLARVGPGRVVFGTDAILHNFHWELGRLLSQDFSEEDLTAILGANMRGLLARRPGRGPDRGGG